MPNLRSEVSNKYPRVHLGEKKGKGFWPVVIQLSESRYRALTHVVLIHGAGQGWYFEWEGNALASDRLVDLPSEIAEIVRRES